MSVILTDALGVEICAFPYTIAVLLDRLNATEPHLELRTELHCEVCAKRLGHRVVKDGPDPFVRLESDSHLDGTMTLRACCRHATRIYRGPFTRQSPLLIGPLSVIHDGSSGGTRTVKLTRPVRDAIVATDLALREIDCRMSFVCTVCEDAGEDTKYAQGANARNGPFRIVCKHLIRVCPS